MAITFENIYKNRVIDNIQKLLKENLSSIPVLYDQHRGQESFLIVPESDSFVDYASNVHIREFSTSINYQLRKGGEYTKDNQLNRLTMVAEIVKRILFDNRNLESDNVSQWYSGQVLSVEYTRDEDDETISNAIITFQCNINEVVS
jgi:hypothetical protein|tara:strand:- start:1043 stop:1480 length:438 start_codon:yes stop_codon:yes gene_type:complete